MRARAVGFLLLFACTHRKTAHQVTGPSGLSEGSVTAEQGAKATRSKPLSLTLSVERTPAGIGLHVVNHGPERVELSPFVIATGQSPGAPTLAEALHLRLACGQQGCVKLDPGSELLAPPWLGQIEGERCDALFRPPHAGAYELVVKACGESGEARTRFVWDGK